MKNLSLLIVTSMLVSCASKIKVMDATAVSMTHDSVKSGEKLSSKGPVTGQYCPDSWKDSGSIGLMDEAVKNAQSSNQVDFILNATFWNTDGCMMVEGEGATILAPKTTRL